MEWLREARPRGSAAGGQPGGGNTRGGERRPGTGEGAPEYWDRAGTGAPGCWLGPRSLERGAERGVGGGDDRVRLRRGRGGQGGPRRDLPMPGAASPGRPPESLLSISLGRAVPPRARLVVFLLSSSTSSGCFCCRSARAPGAVSRNLMRPNWLFM